MANWATAHGAETGAAHGTEGTKANEMEVATRAELVSVPVSKRAREEPDVEEGKRARDESEEAETDDLR